MPEPVRVFIGSGEASLLERKVLTYSLRKNTRRDLDIWVFNGTHNAIERNDEPPVLAPLPLDLKYRSFTEFSLYRYLIPQLCGHEGRAIHLDSDMVCLGDIGDLFDTPLEGHDVLALPEYGNSQWTTSVMLIDCRRCRFDLEHTFREIDAGQYTYADFSRLSPRFQALHPYSIGRLDANWNVFDRYDRHTRLIHYTNLMTQPWKFPGHPCGELWFEYFQEACTAGHVTDEDVQKSIMRGYARPDIRHGNNRAPWHTRGRALLGRLAERVRLRVLT